MQRKMAIGLVVLTILGAIGIVLIKERAVANRRMHISLSTISKHRVVMKKVAVKQAGGSAPILTNDAHVCSNGQIMVTGDASGLVSVFDANANLLQTFQMDANKPVRQVFVLDNGNTVGAAQSDHTNFWNLTTGALSNSIQDQLYGFSSDQTFCIGSTGHGVTLYSYPNLQTVDSLQDSLRGITGWNFSPDNHYLVVQFSGAYPSSDTNYPNPNLVRQNIVITRLYDLTSQLPSRSRDGLSLTRSECLWSEH